MTTEGQNPASAKVVLITGASSGIGAAMAKVAAKKGYSLALTARRGDRLKRLAETLDVETLVIPAAIEDPASPERMIDEVISRFGRLDVLINNAGFGLPSLFAASNPDEIRNQLEVNMIAPIVLARHAIPHLIKRKGVIINIGSAITAIANTGLGAYGPSKAGLAYFSSALRRELLHQGVQVCLVEPGPVKTEFFDAFTRLGPTPGSYHAMLDSPAGWMSAPVDDVANRIIRLIERPRRRLSVRRRFVWPWRLIGALFQICPPLGDLAVSAVVRIYDGQAPRTRTQSRSESHAASSE